MLVPSSLIGETLSACVTGSCRNSRLGYRSVSLKFTSEDWVPWYTPSKCRHNWASAHGQRLLLRL